MPQKLTLPLNECQVNADYMSTAYYKEWKFNHYGADLVDVGKDDRRIFGMGDGVVVSCGMDGYSSNQNLGNCTVIRYMNVLCNDGIVQHLVCRIFHQEKIMVSPGQKITAQTVIGTYGNTGAHSTGPHLHIEFDTDIEYPAYAYGIKASGRVIKKGSKNTTVDPKKVFWLGEQQTVTTEPAWIDRGWTSDWDLPTAAEEETPEEPKFVTLEELAVLLKRSNISYIKL